MANRARIPKLRMGRLIARRVYGWSDGRRSRVVLELGMPRKVPGWDWACPVRITGVDWHPSRPHGIFGIDALQTIELALQYARAMLMAVKPPLSWLDAVGDVGLSLIVPGYFPAEVQERIEAFIDRESRRFERAYRTAQARGASKRRQARRRSPRMPAK